MSPHAHGLAAQDQGQQGTLLTCGSVTSQLCGGRTKRGPSDLQYQGGWEAPRTGGRSPGRTSIGPQMGQRQGLGTTDAILRTTVDSSKLFCCLQSYGTSDRAHGSPCCGRSPGPRDTGPTGSPVASLSPYSTTSAGSMLLPQYEHVHSAHLSRILSCATPAPPA